MADTRTIKKPLELLSLLIASRGEGGLRPLADQLDVPLSTAHRWVASLQTAGFISREKKGHYHPGAALIALLQSVDINQVIKVLAVPLLGELSRAVRRTVQLGVFERDMVTYLVKQPYGREQLFTREGMQLEAYCSGLGKVLLAYSDDELLDSYVADGPFVRLTPKTKTDPAQLRTELAAVRARGFAWDDEEFTEGLVCLAVPVFGANDRVCAALSISAAGDGAKADLLPCLGPLRDCAAALGQRLAGPSLLAPSPSFRGSRRLNPEARNEAGAASGFRVRPLGAPE